MKKHVFRFVILLVGLFIQSVQAQVPVTINSGNPAFPFPQFLDYGTDRKTLASVNAPGVTHAEMEQTIRDAWQIMANAFEYSGESWQGVQYIKGNEGCPYDCSEGDGYALLGAAYMADKKVFDGLWFRTHDLRRVLKPQYRSCGTIIRPGYAYGKNTLAEPGGDAATDGDVDIALALLMAWKQWGDNSTYTNACGTPISYKEEALEVIRGLVERENRKLDPNRFDPRSVSGNVGFDGYFKNGNTWGELTTWANNDPTWKPEFPGAQQLHIDYVAPAYFHSFAEFLKNEGGTAEDLAWNINQLLRAEASSDWLVGQHYKNSPLSILSAGWVSLSNANVATVTRFNEGEDFRFAMRTSSNYMWHGTPTYTWNPTTHQIETGTNTYEYDMALRHAKILKDPGASPWNNKCLKPGGGPALTYSGVTQVTDFGPTGARTWDFPLNWATGTGSAAAVVAQDFHLMGKLYHQSAIEWDITTNGDGYLTSVPKYFHGFFRVLGLMTLSGNYHSPTKLVKEANVKVYHEMDKTYAFTADQLVYTIKYRNYASVGANEVKITTTIPTGLQFVSATGGGILSGNVVSWNVGDVPGFTTVGGVAPTQGQFTMTVKVAPAFSGQICSKFDLTTTNGKGWTSNEYPNNQTAILQRNCVDIVEKAMTIDKTANYNRVNPGQNVTYTINFENASKGGFINGGRPGVNIAYAHGGTAASASQHEFKIRLYHGAAEPYIDYGNYRISMFLNDNTYGCIYGQTGCSGNGWMLANDIYEPQDSKPGVKVSTEAITPGSDSRGAWNQRVIVQFGNELTTNTPHVSRYFGIKGGRVHLGGATPLRAKWRLHSNNFAAINWSDDWSWNPAATDADDGLLLPITNDFTDINNPNIPVKDWHNEACEKPTKFVDNLLVEEWDGYTWRRILGNGPLPGRDISNVVVTDLLPVGFTFVGFIDANGVNVGNTISILGQNATYNAATRTISWSIPKLQVKQGGIIKYIATAGFSSGRCNRADELRINTASIVGTNESPVTDTANVTVTCTEVILPPAPSSMTKTANKANYALAENVTYTLTYTNTNGSITNADLTSAAKWVAQSGAAMPVSSGSLTSVNNDPGVMTYNQSHGTNGTIEASFNFGASAAFGVAFRHTGGAKANGQYIIFKPNAGAGIIEVRAYNGTAQLGTTQTIGYPGDPTNIKIELKDGQVNVWAGNTSNPTATATFTGFPVKAGYAGVINGWANDGGDSYGSHRLRSFKTHLDSAFDLELSDPVPTGITFTSASNSGTNTAGTVRFPVIAGPVLANAVTTRTWVGTVATCPTGGKIVNNAYTNILGITTNSIASQVIVTCGSTIPVCSFTTATLTPSGSTTFCKGKNVTFTAATNGTTNVRYQLYKGNVALGTPQNSTTFVVDSSGSYKVRAFDNLNTTCFAESPVVVVTANPVPVATLTSSATSYCNAPSGITLTAADAGIGATYQFQNGTVVGTASTTRTLANALAGSWAVIVKSSQGCSDTSVATIITANPKPTAAFTRNPTINPVTIGTLVNFTNTSIGANTYQWKIDGVAFETATNSTYTFDKSGAFKIRLIATNTAGCKDSIESTINVDLALTCKAPTNVLPVNALVTRCVGDTANLKASYTLNATPLNGYRFVWYKKGEIIPSYSANTSYVPKAFTNLAETDAGDWTLRIEDGSVGSATCLGETTVKLVVNPIPVTDILPKTAQYCGTTGASISASPNGNGETYEWFKDGLPFGTVSSSNVLNNALAGIYTVQVTSNGCKSVVSSSSVVSQTTAIVPKVEISTVNLPSCAGEMVTLTANPTNATSYEWFVNSQKQTSIIATFSSASLSNNDTVKVILTTDEACANPKIAQDTILAKVQPVLVPTLTLKSVSPKVCAGELVTFEIESSTNAGIPTYTWMVDEVQAATGATFPKTITAKTNVYAIMKTTLACAEPKEVKSEVQVIDLEEKLIPTVEIVANKTTVCENDKIIEFSITARSGTGDKPLYQWLVNGEPILGKTNDSAFFNNLKNDDKVSLRMTSNAACRTKDEAMSNEINITIISLPDSKILNTLLSYCSGSAGITLQAKDLAGATYEWFKGTTSVGTGISLSNATVGSYALKNSIGTCSATSDSVKVTQKALPIAEINPDNLVYCQGATGATLTAKPVAGATYEWLKETVLQGSASTNNQYTSALKGLYSVKVTLDGCDSTSSEVLVTEVGSFPADVKISTTEPTICTGGTATVSIESQSDGTIEWFVDNVSKGNTSPLVFQPTANAKVLAIITTTASCASPKVAKDSLEITVTEAATADLTIKIDKIGGLQCEGDTAYVSATSNVGTVTWSNGTIGNKATFVNWKNGDKIAANLSNTLACVNPKLINKELTLNGTLRAPFDFTLNVVSNSESVICKNSVLNLAAITKTAGLTYSWKNALETGTDSTFKPGTTTTVRGTVTASKTGCFSSGNRISKEKEFIYILTEKIGLAFSQPPSSICENTMSFFTIVPTSGSDNIQQYVWFKNDTLQNGLTENKADFAKLKNGDVLKVKAIPKTVCSAEIPDSTTFRVQVDKQPKHGFTYGTATDILYFCKGKDTVLTANETASYQYTWLEAPANSTNELKIKTKGTYTLVIQNGACTDTSRAVVKDYQLSMEILVEPAAEFEVGEELKLTANVSNPEQRILTYAWSPANLFRPANAGITSMSPTETMFVSVKVKSPENCTLIDSIQLKKRDKLFIPNALTPETGDQNAVWGITGAENYPDMDIKVFNRWGTLVHEQKGYTKQWDGTLNGKPLPAGTYYYVMKHRTLDKPRVGDLTIVR